jgi:hypothetical protein
MEMKTSYSNGFIRGESRSSQDIQAIANGHYDFAVLSSSWDSRCLAVTQASSFSADLMITLVSERKDKRGLMERHEDELSGFAKACSSEAVEVEISSRDVHANWVRIEMAISELRLRKGRPLKGFVDVSACPRFFAVGVMGYCFRRPVAVSMNMFYAEGVYPDRPRDRELDIAFTGGEWAAIAIPYCEGMFFPGKERFYLVSVGFEGGKTLRVVSRADPDRVSLLFPDPSSVEEYVQRAWEDNRALIDYYKIPGEQIVRAEAADAIAGWKELSEKGLERFDSENCFYLCCGTKPHALSMGLRALVTGHPAVLYVLPDQYLAVDIQPVGTYWRYDIHDITGAAGR